VARPLIKVAEVIMATLGIAELLSFGIAYSAN